MACSNNSTNYAICDIAANFTESDESFRITSRAENIYYFDRFGPSIRLIS